MLSAKSRFSCGRLLNKCYANLPLLEHKIIEVISLKLYGETSCEVNASDTNQSLKILCLNLSKINRSVDIFSKLKNQTVRIEWEKYIKDIVSKNDFGDTYKDCCGPQKELQYMLSRLAFDDFFIISYKIPLLGCKWEVYCAVLVRVVLLLDY